MPLYPVNLTADGRANVEALSDGLAPLVTDLPVAAPIVVMVHGFKFSPSVAGRSPHGHILSLEPKACWKAVSWPRRLGLGRGDPAEPLCIAVGWEARGTFWQAYDRAHAAGGGLAALVGAVRALRPASDVQIIAHSLGARVALAALSHLTPGDLGRMVLLAPAELRSVAQRQFATPVGQELDVLHVASAANAVFDRLFEWMIAPHRPGARAVGRGLAQPALRWTDLQIDRPETRAALAGLGYPIAAPDRRICHWSVYRRQGLFRLYRAILTGALSLPMLRAALARQELAPDWGSSKRPVLLPTAAPSLRS